MARNLSRKPTGQQKSGSWAVLVIRNVNIQKIINMKIAKGTKNIVAKNFIIPSVAYFVAKYPEFMPTWLLVQGFFGSLFELRQEKINEFVEYLKKFIND